MADYEINKRLKYLIKEVFKMSPFAFSQKYNDNGGVKTSQVIRERNGLSMQLLESIIEAYPEINRTWLLTGKGEILKGDNIITPIVNYDGKGVPYYDVDFIGGFDMVINDQTTQPSYYINYQPYNKATCWVNVTGHSMEPSICSGDVIALRKIEGWEDFLLLGEIYAIVTDDFRTIKVVSRSANEENYRLVPLNKSAEFSEQDIPKRLIRNVFQVLGAVKKF